MQEFEKKNLKKFIPRLVAFKTTLSFGINSLCSYSSELDQIQIMWPFWPKLPLYEKTLAFKGHEGQERPSNFLFVKFWEVKPMRKSFFFKNMQFLLKQNLSMVEYEGVYFTSAWPFWPLKANFLTSNHFYYCPSVMVKIWGISVKFLAWSKNGPKEQK